MLGVDYIDPFHLNEISITMLLNMLIAIAKISINALFHLLFLTRIYIYIRDTFNMIVCYRGKESEENKRKKRKRKIIST